MHDLKFTIMHIYPILDHSGVSLTENSIIVKGTLLCKLSSIFLLVINRSFQQQVIGASGVNSSTDLSTYLPICLLETCLFIGTIWYNQSIYLVRFIYPFIYLVLPIYLVLSIYIYLSGIIHPSIWYCLSVWHKQSVHQIPYVSIYLFIYPSIHRYIRYFLSGTIHLAIIYLLCTIHVSIHPSPTLYYSQI